MKELVFRSIFFARVVESNLLRKSIGLFSVLIIEDMKHG